MTTHYEMEDLPPTDADTQVALYERASEVVADSLRDAQQLFHSAEAHLKTLFESAETAGNEGRMELVNMIYDSVQRMAGLMGQQGAALRGANGAIDALKNQRDQVMEELNSLIKAINDADVDDPRLEELHQTIQEWEMEYADSYMWDMMNDDVSGHLKVLLDGHTPYRSIHMLAYDLVDAIRGGRNLNHTQKALLVELVMSFDKVPKQGGES